MTGPTGAAPAAGGASTPLDVLAAQLIALYTAAEQRLIAELATAAGDDQAGQLVMLTAMRRAAQRVATALAMRSAPLVKQITDTAAQDGDKAAWAALRRQVEGHASLARLYLDRFSGTSGHAAAAAVQIRLELAASLDATRTGILRTADDAYRAAVADAAQRLVAAQRGHTPATAQHAAWNRLTRQGVTGYTDTTGRRWNLGSYVEMATRTATQRAYNAAAEARYRSLGIDYFTISHDGHPCPLCRPWEGAVLSNGRAGTVVDASALDGSPVAFVVKGTVDQARAAGLFHPNCRHVPLPYFPGVTKTTPPRPWSPADQAAYDATQRLRYLERQVRAAKRVQAAALDPASKRRAGVQVRAAQARIREHVDRHGLVRRTRREQLDLGNKTQGAQP